MTENKSQNFKKWYILIAIANLVYIVLFYMLMRLFT